MLLLNLFKRRIVCDILSGSINPRSSVHFNNRVRKELREKIDGMNYELSTLMDTINGMEAEIDEKITPLQKRFQR